MLGIDKLAKYPLVLWNDSAVAHEIRDAADINCRGATTNPSLILNAAQAEQQWTDRATALLQDSSPEVAARLLANEIRVATARELIAVFNSTSGREGRLCVQIDPRNHENPESMVAEALELNQLASNLYI